MNPTPFLDKRPLDVSASLESPSAVPATTLANAQVAAALTPRFCIACRHSIPHRASFCPDCGIRQ